MACNCSTTVDIITECMTHGDSFLLPFDYLEGPTEEEAVPVSLAARTIRVTFRDESDAVALALVSGTPTAGGSEVLLDVGAVVGRNEIWVSKTDASAAPWKIEELTFDVEMEWSEGGRDRRETILNGSKIVVAKGRTR